MALHFQQESKFGGFFSEQAGQVHSSSRMGPWGCRDFKMRRASSNCASSTMHKAGEKTAPINPMVAPFSFRMKEGMPAASSMVL